MALKREMTREELIAAFRQIVREVYSDPRTAELAEEYQRRYGTLTEEDLIKVFTI